MATSPLHTPEDLDKMLAALEAELSTLEIPGSAGVPPASDRRTPAPDSDSTTPQHHPSHPSHSPTADPTLDQLEESLNTAWQSAHNAERQSNLARRLAQIEPLVEIIELVEPRIKLLARDRRQHTAREVITHIEEVTRLATRSAALRKTLIQILHHPLPNPTTTPGTAPIPPAPSQHRTANTTLPGSAGVPPASSSPDRSHADRGSSDCSAGAPAGHVTPPAPSCAPQGRRPVATGEAMQRIAQPVDPVPNKTRAPEGHRIATPNATPNAPNAPSSTPDSSFSTLNSPKPSPIPPIPKLPKGFTDPNPQNPHTPLNYPTPHTEADVENLMKTIDTLRDATLAPNATSPASTPSINSVASVPTIRSIPTIPFTKLQATAQKLYKDVLTLTRNHPAPTPNPPSTQNPAPSTQSARITHTPNTIPHTTIQNIDAHPVDPTPPDPNILNSQISDFKSLTTPAPSPGTPDTFKHAGARPPHNAIDDTVATVTGVSGPKARHTTVTDAQPTHNAHPTQANPQPNRTKVWKGGDGGVGEGEENFSKLSSPSPTSPTHPNSTRPPP